MTSRAPGTVMVISTMGIPPCQTASAANLASCGEAARTTGTIPISSMRARTSCFLIKRRATFSAGSAGDSRSRAFHHVKNFVERRHGRIARRGHSQCPMSGSAFDGPLRVLSREKTVNEARSKGVTAANTVENFEILAILGLIEIALVVANRAPIVSRGSGGFAKRGGDDFEGKVVQNLPDHLFEGFRVECGERLAGSGHFVAKRRREIFFIAEYDVHVGSDAAVDFLSPLLSAERSPQRITIVQVIGNDDAVFSRAFHCFDGNFWSRLGQRAEDPTRMKPTRAIFAEDRFPIDLTRLQRGHRCVAAIGAAQSPS